MNYQLPTTNYQLPTTNYQHGIKETVNNDNLPILGGIVINIFATESSTPSHRTLYFNYGTGGFTIEIISGNGYFTDSSGNRLSDYDGKKIVFTTQTARVYFSNHNGKALLTPVYNIYKITGIDSYTMFASIDIASLNYMGTSTSQQSIDFPNMKRRLYGNLSDFKPIKDVNELNLSYANNVTGKIQDIAIAKVDISYTSVSMSANELYQLNLEYLNVAGNSVVIGGFEELANTKIETLVVNNSGITGSIESFAEAMLALAGRVNDTINVTFGTTQTYHGKIWSGVVTVPVVFSGNTIVITHNTGYAEYDGSTWTYHIN